VVVTMVELKSTLSNAGPLVFEGDKA